MSAPDVKGRESAGDDGMLDFVAAALRLFGPRIRLRMERDGTQGTFTFPADPAWVAPIFKPHTPRRIP